MSRPIKYGLIGASGRMGKEIAELLGEARHELVFKFDLNSREHIQNPELIIDFSLPSALNSTIDFCNEFKCGLIIGTTGLSPDNFDELKKLSGSVPVIQSYNFSVGIQMLIKCAQLLNNYLSYWDIEITETHHRFKKDKPSGTAIMLKELFDREVNITSQRLGNVPGDHTVSFGALGEVISISHRALSRRTFAEGVLKSIEFIMDKDNGLFSFKDVLEK